MGYKRKLLTVLGIAVSLFCSAQGKLIKTAEIGDDVPNLDIPKIINWQKKQAKISDFHSQLLILDFWSIGCSGCIEALPKMEALQQQFGNKIRILPVSEESETLVLEFWKNNKYTKKLSLPSVVADKSINAYFKHRSIPHEVWIYNGKVIAITEPEYVDAHNIEKVLKGEHINWPLKYDYYSFDRNKPLFKLDPTQIDTANSSTEYAAISDFREETVSLGFSGEPGIIRNARNKTVRTFFLNESILNAYLGYWSKIIKLTSLVKPTMEYQPNQFAWEVKNRDKYRYVKGAGYWEDWLRSYAICFESQHLDSGQNDSQIYRSIINDMDRLLGLKVRWEKRIENILILRKSTGEFIPEKISAFSRPYSIYELIKIFSQKEDNPYIFNESGFKGNEILQISISPASNLVELRKELQHYGLELQETKREVDKLIFSEINTGLLVDATLRAIKTAKQDNQK